MRRLFYGFVLSLTVLLTASCAADETLNANDVSWLWPVPQNTADRDRLISMGELTDTEGRDVWSDAHFESMLEIIEGAGSTVGDSQIRFPEEFREKQNWFIAGMRLDPTAPGDHPLLPGIFGRSPQIRLVIQPVTQEGDEVKVHDVAIHVVYSYVANPTERKKIPLPGKFESMLEGVHAIKSITTESGAATDGKPLGVHPGLDSSNDEFNPEVGEAMRGFLTEHLRAERLSALAIMGIPHPAPEPWIFLALTITGPETVSLIPEAAGPFAQPQMIDFRQSPATVTPTPVVSNLDPARRHGVATDILFQDDLAMDEFAVIGKNDSGEAIVSDTVRNRDVADVIASPTLSHFFNTDCVSCHTESQRRNGLGLELGEFAFKHHGESPPIAESARADQRWNVRNFGWFPDFFQGGKTSPSVTQRTANETAEVLAFIEEHFDQ